MKHLRILKKKDGYVLVWVLIVFFVLVIISSITVTSIYTTIRTTSSQHNSQQAYYTARSAVISVANYIMKNANNTTLIDQLTQSTGTGSKTSMGSYSVNVSYVASDRIRVKATATYLGFQRTLSAYLIKSPAPSGILPTDNAIYINGGADPTSFKQCIINGDMFVDGNYETNNNRDVNGKIVVKGNATFSKNGGTTDGIFCYGNLIMESGCEIGGDVLVKGDVTINGGTIKGNVKTDKNLIMSSGTIEKSAFVGVDAKFTGGKILQNLSYFGSISPLSLNAYVMGSTIKLSSYSTLDTTSYSSQPLAQVVTPTQAQKPSMYNSVVINSDKITANGKITSAVVSQIKGEKITIDTTSQDINLLLDGVAFSGANLEVIGPNNCFIYMTGNSSISLNSEYIGMYPHGTNPKLYIFGDGAQTIDLGGSSGLNAVVYIPNGTLSASANASQYLDNYKFIGCCITKNINVNGNIPFKYSEPNLTNTPLEIFLKGQQNSGASTWCVEGWEKE